MATKVVGNISTDKDGNLEFDDTTIVEYISISKALKEILQKKESFCYF